MTMSAATNQKARRPWVSSISGGSGMGRCLSLSVFAGAGRPSRWPAPPDPCGYPGSSGRGPAGRRPVWSVWARREGSCGGCAAKSVRCGHEAEGYHRDACGLSRFELRADRSLPGSCSPPLRIESCRRRKPSKGGGYVSFEGRSPSWHLAGAIEGPRRRHEVPSKVPHRCHPRCRAGAIEGADRRRAYSPRCERRPRAWRRCGSHRRHRRGWAARSPLRPWVLSPAGEAAGEAVRPYRRGGRRRAPRDPRCRPRPRRRWRSGWRGTGRCRGPRGSSA